MQKKPSYKVILKFLSIVILIIVFIVVSLMLSVRYLYQKEIKVIALEHLNQQLNSPVEIKDISIGVFSNFPLVAISLSEIKIEDPIHSKDTLFYCEKLDLNFNAVDLINQNYKVRKLKISSGELNIKITKTGIKNYLVIKDSNTNKNSNFRFILDQVSLSNFNIKYQNDILFQEYSFLCNNATLYGDFNDDFYDLEMQSDLFINYFVIDKLNYVKNKEVKFSSVINVINEPFTLKIKEGVLKIAEMDFSVSGDYLSSSDDKINLSINGKNIKLSEVFSVFPLDYFSILERYSSKGKLNFNSTLEGSVSKSNRLLFKANFNAENASFFDLDNDISMSKINLKGNYNNAKQFLEFSSFSAFIEDKKISGKFSIKEFKNPLFKFSLKGDLDLAKTSFFIKENPININGIASFDLESELKWVNSSPYFKFVTGDVKSKEILLSYLPTKFVSKIEGLQLNFPYQDLIFSASSVKVNNDQLEAQLKLKNWLDVLIGKNKTIETDFKLYFQNLNLNQWLTYFPFSNDTSKTSLTKKINGDILVDNLTFNKVKMENVKINKISINEKVEISSVIMKGQGGNYDFSCSSSNLSAKEVNLNLHGEVQLISANKLFKEFENFDQNWVTSDHLFGSFSSELSANLLFDQKGQLIHDKSRIKSSNQFKDFELVKFSFFEEVLNYFKENTITKKIMDMDYYENQLNKVVFEDFESEISMSNSQIEIQETQINNNILDLNFFGIYAMNDSVDYHLSFDWRDIKKKNKPKKEFNIEDDGLGKKLYLKIYGFLDDLNYGLDKGEIKKKRKEKLKEEKQAIKQIINGEVPKSNLDSKTPVFEIESEEDIENSKDVDSTNSFSVNKKSSKKKKDSSRLNKFLKKIGVEEEDKKKPKFEINQ